MRPPGLRNPPDQIKGSDSEVNLMDEIMRRASRGRRVGVPPRPEVLEGRRLMAANPAQVGFGEYATTAPPIWSSPARRGRMSSTSPTTGRGTRATSPSRSATARPTPPRGPSRSSRSWPKGGDDQVNYKLTGNLVTSDGPDRPRRGERQFTSNLAGDIANPTASTSRCTGRRATTTCPSTRRGRRARGPSRPTSRRGRERHPEYNGTGTSPPAHAIPGLTGGAGNDTITSNYSGQVDGNYVYELTADGGAGNDNIIDNIDMGANSTGTSAPAPVPPRRPGGRRERPDPVRHQRGPDRHGRKVNAVVIGGGGKDVVQQTSNVLSDRSSEADTILS